MIGTWGGLGAQVLTDPGSTRRLAYGAAIVGTAAANGASSYAGPGFAVRGSSWGDVYADTYTRVFTAQTDAGVGQYWANIRAKAAAKAAQREEKARIRAGVQTARAAEVTTRTQARQEGRTARTGKRQTGRTKRRQAGGGFDWQQAGETAGGYLDALTGGSVEPAAFAPAVDVSMTDPGGDGGGIPRWAWVVGGVVLVGGVAAVMLWPKKQQKKKKKTPTRKKSAKQRRK